MRYEDASATDSFNADQALTPSSLSAQNDADVILAGHYGPATGNAITGTGTISGSAGADMVGAGATVTAIQGAGGTDTTFSGGNLQIAGQYGVLTMNAQGQYSYVRNQGTPDGVSDVFAYTIAGRDGGSDVANLTINIGKTPVVVQANAARVVPGPDGVVTLPPGVELSDIHVVGRDLVIDMPDGSQMIIVDGAVFVPQLVLGTVEVPSTNLAALLIDSEPTPAAGPPQSSGGNFAVPVAPLDPGAPLGDLIPPTELSYTPPTFEEVAQAIEEDEVVLITDLTPAVSGGDVTVDEDDLADGSDTSKESLTVAGTFTLIAPDGVDSLTVGTLSVIVNGNFQAGATLTTPLGNTLTITGYNAATGVVSYTYALGDNEAHASGAGENSLFEDFLVTLTDEDGDVDTDTLSVNIIDDIPTANDDVAGLLGGGPISVTVDVDTNDVPGADGIASRIFASLAGTYGNLTLNADGTQTYTLNAAGIAAMNNLAVGATLTDTFTYTLTDGDGDSDPANLVVTLTGNDRPVLITNLTPSAQGGDAIVDEDDLPDGSDTSKESLTVTGDFTISAPDGVDDLTVGGVQVIINGVFQAGASGLTPLGNTLTITGYNAATGVVSYSYTLNDNEAHPNANGQNSIFEDLTVSLSDQDGDVDTDTLSVQIVDDVPVANDDAFSIFEGDADNAITFDVDLNDIPGADGTASRVFTSLVGTYGNLTLNGDGTQTYTLNAAGVLAINALAPGATLQDNFSYTLTDTDGDSDPANLVISLTGVDDPPVITNLTPSAQGGDAIVDEDDLPDGSDTSKESLTVNGDFTISAPDGVDDLTVGGIQVIVNGVFQVGATGATPLGNTIIFTGYNAVTGVVSYSYTLLDNESHPNANGQNSLFDDMAVVLTDTDNDIANATLSVQIVDDVPVANDDAFSIFEGDADNAITFDVDLNDVPGADGTASRIFTSLTGTYGNLTLNGDGTQTYTLNAAGVLAINALAPGATLQDNFSYTLTDTDGDADPANLVITLTGVDDPPVITNLTPSAQGGDAIVDEDDLPDGSDSSKESLTVNGDFTISAPDGINDLTVNGIDVFIDGVFQAGASGATPLGNTITFTGYNAATGVVSYSYTLLDNETHANANGENSLFDDMSVVLTDTDNDIANGTLSVQIVDDVPTANDDAFTIFEGDADNAITFDVDLNDVPGADGTASRTFTSLVGTYGNLVVNGDGTQTYTLNAAGVLAINALAPGATLQDNFSYTLTDGDGDADPATLVITLSGTDDPPVITNLNPSTNGGDAIVDEDDLVPDGSDPTKESTTVTGDFTISAPDGVNDLTVNGINVIIDGVFQVGATGATPLGNTITFTGYNAATGVVSYSYTLLDNESHPNANGENSLFDDMAVVLTDTDNDIANATLSVQIVDDVPTANDDAFTIFEGDTDNAITFDVDLNDVPGADGTASRVFTSLIGTYGTLSHNGDGTQTYTLNAAGVLAINALAPGATLQDNFSYTLTDTDGDSDPANLVITLQGTDDPVLITNLTPSAQGGDVIVDEDDLADGSDTSKESLTVNGDFTISAPDGVNDLTVGGFDVIIDGVFQPGSHVTPLGNTLTFISYNAGTGVVSYSYTLVDNEAHPNANGENSIFEDFAVVLTDVDNDVDTDTLSVQIVDDVPTANNDTVGQVGENNPVVIDAFANDVFGADGVDIDNNPNVVVTFTQPPVGQGTVSYNAATGQFTFTPVPGQEGSTQFTYTITDGDGDQSTATVTVNLVADSNPQASAEVAIVDDDGLPGGIPASGTNDLNANTGEDTDPSEAIWTGVLNANFGGDTPGSFSFSSSLTGTTATMGQETVTFTVSGGGTLLTANITASPDATRLNDPLFTVQITNQATGAYTVTLVDNVLHASLDGLTGDNTENPSGPPDTDVVVTIPFTATDSELESTTANLTITFDDDMPVGFTPQDAVLTNEPGGPVVFGLDGPPGDGNIANNFGADGPGTVRFLASVDGTDSGMTSGGAPIVYDIDNSNPNILYGKVGSTIIFTITLDHATSTYSVDLDGVVDSLTTIDFNDGSYDFTGGNSPWAGFVPLGQDDADGGDTPLNDNSQDLLITPFGVTTQGDSVSGNANSAGVNGGGGGQNIGANEGIRLDFVTDLTGDPAGAPANYDANAAQRDHVFDGHYKVNDVSVQFGDGAGNSTVKIEAFDATENASDQVLGNGTLVNITQIIISYDGENQVFSFDIGNLSQTLSVGSTGGAPDRNYTVLWVLDSPGVYHVEVTGILDTAVRIATHGAVAYEALELQNISADDPALDFAITGFGAAIQSTDPVLFTVPIEIVDADGDAIASQVDVTLNPPEEELTAPPDGFFSHTSTDFVGMNHILSQDGHLLRILQGPPESAPGTEPVRPFAHLEVQIPEYFWGNGTAQGWADNNIDAIHATLDGKIFFSMESGKVARNGGDIVANSALGQIDIFVYDPITGTISAATAAHGAAFVFPVAYANGDGKEKLDALHIIDGNNIIFSSKSAGSLPGATFQANDLVHWNGTTATVVFDANDLQGAFIYTGVFGSHTQIPGNAGLVSDGDSISDITAVHVLSFAADGITPDRLIIAVGQDVKNEAGATIFDATQLIEVFLDSNGQYWVNSAPYFDSGDNSPADGGEQIDAVWLGDVDSLPTGAPPVVLDMDGDGAEFVDQSAGVAYDYGNGLVATAWVGADDAILVRDANANGLVDDASEFVFGGGVVTDLQALAAQYGDTLDANDADFGKFAVWQDANSNGVVDAGEMQSLTAAGIASLSLVSDGVGYAAAGGDVGVRGTATYTRADGSTHSLVDAVFKTGGAVANTNTAMIAALAAAGVAAAPAAAQPADLASASAVAIAAALVASNGSAIDSDDVSRPGLGNETKEAVVDESAAGSSSASSADQVAGGRSLTADNDVSPASQPVDLLEATEAPAIVNVADIVAPMVSMPSAEALIAASLNGNASDGSQSNAVVGKVLADALEGGGADASVDALLEALPAQGLGGNAAVEALASQPDAAVSAWDMGPMGGLSANANFTMEAMALHHDAVQPVANG